MRKLIILFALLLVLVPSAGFGVQRAITRYGAPGFAGCRFVKNPHHRMSCLASRAEGMVRDDGAVKAMTSANAAASKYPAIEMVCHLAMHFTAHRTYRSLKRSFLSVQHVKTGICAAGYRHGVIEAAVKAGTLSDLRKLAGFCGEYDKRDVTDCYHAIGHALDRRDGLEPALRTCEKTFPDTRTARVECMTGAHMQEEFRSREKLRESRDPVGPCRKLAYGDQSQSCYLFVPINGAFAAQLSLDASAGLCAAVTRRLDRQICFAGIGAIVPKDNPELCEVAGSPEGRTYCLRAYLKLRGLENDAFPTKYMKVCTDMHGGRRTECAQAAGLVLRYYHVNQLPGGSHTCNEWFEDGDLAVCTRSLTEGNPGSINDVVAHG